MKANIQLSEKEKRQQLQDHIIEDCLINIWSATKVNNNIIFKFTNENVTMTMFQIELLKMLSTLTQVNVIVKSNIFDYINIKKVYKKSLDIKRYSKIKDRLNKYNTFSLVEMIKYVCKQYNVNTEEIIEEIYNFSMRNDSVG